MPSASVWRMPERAGDVGADAVRGVGVHLALEPDHQHDRDEQHHERDDDLGQDDEHDREVDVTGEERIDGEHGYPATSRRTSVTAASALRRLPTDAFSWLPAIAATPRGTLPSATVFTTNERSLAETRTRPASVDAELLEVGRVQPEHGVLGEPGGRRAVRSSVPWS